MKNRTKVLGGGGYNVVQNDSITLQNAQDNCKKQRESCRFLQNNKKSLLLRFVIIMLALSFIFQFFIIVKSPETKVDNTQCVPSVSLGNLIGINLADEGVASHWSLEGPFIAGYQKSPWDLYGCKSGEILVGAHNPGSDNNAIFSAYVDNGGDHSVVLPIKEINELLAGDNRTLTVDYFLNQKSKKHYTLDSNGNNPKYIPETDDWLQYSIGNPVDESEDNDKIVMFTVVYKDSRNINVTLNCELSGEGYMVNVYKGDEIYKQMYVTTATYTFELEFVSNYSNTYRLAFVFGYYGNLTFDAKNATTGINTNITTATRSATINSLVDTTIKFTLANPRINSTIII